MSNYIPIACSLHDQLEDAIVRRVSGKIVFMENGQLSEIEERLIDWTNQKGEEFVITESGLNIRLDKIVELFGIPFQNKHC